MYIFGDHAELSHLELLTLNFDTPLQPLNELQEEVWRRLYATWAYLNCQQNLVRIERNLSSARQQTIAREIIVASNRKEILEDMIVQIFAKEIEAL